MNRGTRGGSTSTPPPPPRVHRIIPWMYVTSVGVVAAGQIVLIAVGASRLGGNVADLLWPCVLTLIGTIAFGLVVFEAVARGPRQSIRRIRERADSRDLVIPVMFDDATRNVLRSQVPSGGRVRVSAVLWVRVDGISFWSDRCEAPLLFVRWMDAVSIAQTDLVILGLPASGIALGVATDSHGFSLPFGIGKSDGQPVSLARQPRVAEVLEQLLALHEHAAPGQES